MKTAKLGIRALAAIVDSLIVSLAWYYIIEFFGHVGSVADHTTASMGGDKSLTEAPALLLMLATAAFWILPEWLVGVTIGKYLCGLRVASLDSGVLSFRQSLKRNLLRLIDFFPSYLTGFLTASLTPNRQRLGDLWAKTIVVRKKDIQADVEVIPPAIKAS